MRFREDFWQQQVSYSSVSLPTGVEQRMGIRFYCPNGHKLNVKDFLAGKRGICPECSARFQIPQESQIPKGAPKVRPASAAVGETAQATTSGAAVVVDQTPVDPIAAPQQSSG